jgi:hydroxyacylglutathione hydrolase
MQQYITHISALKDNYIWLLIVEAAQTCIVVDPGESAQVIHAIQARQLNLQAVLLTHHHEDHTKGARALRERYRMPVYGPAVEEIPTVTHPLLGGENIQIGQMRFDALAIPGHTRGHLAYYNGADVFCGDTLFTGGCGRVFEGTMAQMYQSLQRLAALPDITNIYCGHEYTVANLAFAARVEPENVELQQRIGETARLRAQGLPTVPSTLALEKATNPFLRCGEISVKRAAEQQTGKVLDTPEEVFAVLREWKNSVS